MRKRKIKSEDLQVPVPTDSQISSTTGLHLQIPFLYFAIENQSHATDTIVRKRREHRQVKMPSEERANGRTKQSG